MGAVITWNELRKALKPTPACMTKEKWEEIDTKALTTIQLCLTNQVLCEIVHCTTTTDLWINLRILHE